MVWQEADEKSLTEADLDIIGRKAARIDIPLLSRESLRNISKEFHDLSMQLGQLSVALTSTER